MCVLSSREPWGFRHDDARWTIVFSHHPLFPYGGAKPRHYLYGHVGEDDARREVRDLLTRRRAVVIEGHVHYVANYRYERPEGRIAQFLVSSLWRDASYGRIDLDEKGSGRWTKKLISSGASLGEDFHALAEECAAYLGVTRAVLSLAIKRLVARGEIAHPRHSRFVIRGIV